MPEILVRHRLMLCGLDHLHLHLTCIIRTMHSGRVGRKMQGLALGNFSYFIC